MARWTDLSAEQLADLSSRNRASRVIRCEDKRQGSQVPATSAQRSHGPVIKPELLELAKKRAAKRRERDRKRISIPTEHQEQAAVVAWFDGYAATHKIDPRLLFAIPNGSNKSIPAAAKFKAEGLLAGVPDLMLAKCRLIVVPDAIADKVLFHGLFIEMKRQDGKARPEQLEFHELLKRQGYRCIVARGADEAIRAIMEYLA